MPASLLGRGLKPLPNRPACSGWADLEHRQGPVEVDPAPAQPSQLAKA
jgi:hypothetical protein